MSEAGRQAGRQTKFQVLAIYVNSISGYSKCFLVFNAVFHVRSRLILFCKGDFRGARCL